MALTIACMLISVEKKERGWRLDDDGLSFLWTFDSQPTEISDALANEEERGRMGKDNFGGTSSDVWVLRTAPVARLRNGFDEMKIHGGAYRTNAARRNGGSTARFYILVDGTPKGSSYGDVFIPKGNLYFSLPSFSGVSQLSKKEGLVTVRQLGWHTGWRREASRMVCT